jgi:hypothetical protein
MHVAMQNIAANAVCSVVNITHVLRFWCQCAVGRTYDTRLRASEVMCWMWWVELHDGHTPRWVIGVPVCVWVDVCSLTSVAVCVRGQEGLHHGSTTQRHERTVRKEL